MEIYSDKVLNDFRNRTDPAADSVIEAYFPNQKNLLQTHLDALSNNQASLPIDALNELADLFNEIKRSAQTFDKEELQKGQAFFDHYASDIMLLLGFLSLPYCYAAANGAEVLVRSNRILNEPSARLMDTAQFVFDVTAGGAFEPEGRGLVSILKVRLLHAATRWYINKAGDWDSEVLGKPVNLEDMAGTNLAFSLITVRGLRKLGKFVEPVKAFVYINYWNKIGLLLGLDESLLPADNKEAFILEKRIRARQFRKSESGTKLTESLLNYYEKATVDTPLEGYAKTFMVFLLGDKVARQIGLEIDNYNRMVFKPYALFIRFRDFFFKAQDSYAKAYSRFKSQQT